MEAPRPEEARRHKLHHSYIWLSSVRALPYLLLAVIASGGSGLVELGSYLSSGEAGFSLFLLLGLVLLIIVVIAGIVMAVAAISYRYIWYEFGTAEFSYCSGIFSKKRVHVPYQKVQSVNEKASLLQRVAGVCTVSIDTAGGADNKAIAVPYVGRSAAERIRQELFYRKRLMDAGLSPDEADAQVRQLQAQQAYVQAQQAAVPQMPQPPAYAPVPPTPGPPVPPTPTAQGAPPAPWGYAEPAAPQPVAPAAAPPAPAVPYSAPTPVASQPAAPAPAVQQPWPVAPQSQSAPGASWPSQPAPAPAAPQPAAPQPVPAGNVLDMPAGLFDDLRGAFGGMEVDTGAVSYEFGLSNKELILSAVTGKSSFALVLVGVVATLASGLSMLIDAHVLSGDPDAYSSLWTAIGSSGPLLWGLLASGILSILALVWLASVVGACLSFGGFRARRRGERVEVERGLISHVFTGIDVDRIQSIVIHQSFFQRLLGCCSVSYGRIGTVDASSPDQSQASTSSALVVHPFLRLDRVQEVVSQLTPEYADLPQADRRVSPKALRRGITRRAVLQGLGFWLAVVAVGVYALVKALVGGDLTSVEQGVMDAVLIAVLVLAAVILVVEAIGAVLWYRRAGFGYSRRFVTLVNGGYSIDTVVMPRTKVQFAGVRTNPLQRRVRTATLFAVSAAGVGGKTERLVDVSETDARDWLAWVHPHGASKV